MRLSRYLMPMLREAPADPQIMSQLEAAGLSAVTEGIHEPLDQALKAITA